MGGMSAEAWVGVAAIVATIFLAVVGAALGGAAWLWNAVWKWGNHVTNNLNTLPIIETKLEQMCEDLERHHEQHKLIWAQVDSLRTSTTELKETAADHEARIITLET